MSPKFDERMNTSLSSIGELTDRLYGEYSRKSEKKVAKNQSVRRGTNPVKNLRNLFDKDGQSRSPSPNKPIPINPVPSPRQVSKTPLVFSPEPNDESRKVVKPEVFLDDESGLPSPSLVILQKRVAELQDKLRKQEERHIEERLQWHSQAAEIQRLRAERDRLSEQKTTLRRQLNHFQDIAEGVMDENKDLRSEISTFKPKVVTVPSKPAVDWEQKLEALRQESQQKDQDLGSLKAQLEERSDQLNLETKVNTDFVMQLQETEANLREQSSMKDLRLGILAAELEEKEQQLALETELNTELVAELRATESTLREQANKKDLTIQRLTEELNQSKGQLRLLDSSDRNMMDKEREELREVKKLVVQEVEAVAVVSTLRGAMEQMQRKIEQLEKSNKKLRRKLAAQ